MKIVVFTSNSLRHKYIANLLSQAAGDAFVVSECKPHDGIVDRDGDMRSLVEEHFILRANTEEMFFGDEIVFRAPAFPILHKEANASFVYEAIKKYNPDAGFVFGSSIIKEPLLSLIPSGKFINLHLGLSPYYRGSGTNFWPLANGEPQYVGATLLHIDPGIDTGDILAHIRPGVLADDTVHTLGCKAVVEAGKALVSVVGALKDGRKLSRVPQWKEASEKFYRKADFGGSALRRYYENLEKGMLRDYTEAAGRTPRLVPLHI